ncbi:MAG: hypothetical protein M0R17_05145 [Candidatus Omnitrophica bacterium]|jgi:hypothetical protein|nr:hypothetical protein [Candidatus Omnitrophota bacterium]
MSSFNLTSVPDIERLKAIKEVCKTDECELWNDKSDVFDFYHENFEFLLKIIQKQEEHIEALLKITKG